MATARRRAAAVVGGAVVGYGDTANTGVFGADDAPVKDVAPVKTVEVALGAAAGAVFADSVVAGSVVAGSVVVDSGPVVAGFDSACAPGA
nr:hypothetical protein [Micromonospora sp. DSM 115978]